LQRPSYYNPYRSPDRARERRNLVLTMMRGNGYLTEQEFHDAEAAPIKVVAEPPENMQAQYFVDLMNDELQSKLDDHDKQMRSIYTTLDPELQQAAEEAVHAGMNSVDQLLHANKSKKGRAAAGTDRPQVALIALDPHTGEIKALVGGRDYAASQLNHVLAMRQPGSVFKSFVYAAALDTAVSGGPHIFTPASVVDDSPTTFYYGRKAYQPANFHEQFMGSVTLRTALAHSLNVATVQVAQTIGFDRVVAMAQRAGLNDAIKPTPAVALGAYETTPLEIAGAYTLFANHGARVTPTTIALVRAPDSSVIYEHRPDDRQALDPRVAYLMVNMMQDVLRNGTGAGVRSRGFTLPAAGKTGTSHDGWFAGFTSNLLCVVWVGFDDNRELNLEGAKSALPIWAEFMKHATQFRKYRDAQPFQAPPGILNVRICGDNRRPGRRVLPQRALRRLHRRHPAGHPVPVTRLAAVGVRRSRHRLAHNRHRHRSPGPAACGEPASPPTHTACDRAFDGSGCKCGAGEPGAHQSITAESGAARRDTPHDHRPPHGPGHTRPPRPPVVKVRVGRTP